MPVQFVNITKEQFLSKNKLIYKYCTLENCLDMLQNRHLYFVNPTEWKDPFESRFLENQYQIDNESPVECPWNHRIYCTCTTETSDSEAYWKVYPQQQIGIRLAFYRERLLEKLEQYCLDHPEDTVYIGKVQYQKTDDILKNIANNSFISKYVTSKGIDSIDLIIRLLLLKRSAFAYEDEIRFFIVTGKTILENSIELPLNAPMNELVRLITIDPNVQPNTLKVLINHFISTYGFDSIAPYTHRVEQSLLYKELGATTIKLRSIGYIKKLHAKFEAFMDVVDWDELTLGEQEELYEITYSKHDDQCTLFNISFNGDKVTIVYQLNPDEALDIYRKELPDFRKWLEDEYMGGEEGHSYFAYQEAMEKDD